MKNQMTTKTNSTIAKAQKSEGVKISDNLLEKHQKFSQYVEYIKTFPLENHLMIWFETNYNNPNVPDLVEEIMYMIAEKINSLVEQQGIEPIDPNKLAEDPEMYSI